MNPSRLLRTTFLSVLALALIGGLATVQAQNIFVSTAGDDANGGTGVSNPKATIQAGIDAAAEGETVQIEDGFYDESAVLNKDVNLQVVSNLTSNPSGDDITGGVVEVRALTLDTGDGSDPGETTEGDRAELFPTSGTDNTLRATSTLEVVSGFYALDDGGNTTSNLQIGDGGTIVWSAGEPSSGDRLANGNNADPVATARESGGSYNLEFANSSDYSSPVNSDQIPTSDLQNVTIDNTAELTTPNDLANPAGDFTVTSGSDVTLDAALTVSGTFSNSGTFDDGGNTLTANGDVSNSGTLFDDTGITIAGGDNTISGSSAFKGLTVSGSYDATSSLTVTGTLTLSSSDLDVSGNGLTAQGDITFDGGTITTDSAGDLALTGSSDQKVSLDGSSDETVAHLTVNKPTSVNVDLDDTVGGSNALKVSDNFDFVAGRVELGSTNNSDLTLEGAATIGGIIQDENSDGALTLSPSSSSSTIAGNGIIEVPLTLSNDNDVTFSELATVNDVTIGGSGSLTFSQQVALEGNVTYSGSNTGNVDFDAGTSSGSTGNINLTSAGSGAEITFADDATVGDITAPSAGTVTFDGTATIGNGSGDDIQIGNNGGGGGSLSEAISVTLNGSGNTINSDVQIGNPGTDQTGADASLNLDGSTTISGSVDLENGGSDADVFLNLNDVADGATTTVNGSIDFTATDESGTTAELVIDDDAADDSDSQGHSLVTTSGFSYTRDGSGTDGDGTAEVKLTLDASSSITLDGTSLDLAALEIDGTKGDDFSPTLNGSFTFEGSATQTADFGTLTSDIATLTVDNSTVEDTGGDALQLQNNNIDADNLVLTDGRVDTDGVSFDINNGGSVTRAGGSIVTDGGGSFDTPSGGNAYDLTYKNSSAIDTGAEVSSGDIQDLSFEGSGTVTMQGGITAGNSSNFDGTLNVNSDATVATNGNTLTVLSENSSAATVATVDGTISGSGDLDLNLNGSTADATIDGNGSIPSLTSTLNSGNGSSDLAVTDTLSISNVNVTTQNDGNEVTFSSDDVEITESLTIGGSSGDIIFPEDGLPSVGGDASFSNAEPTFNQKVTFDSTFTASSSAVTIGTGNFDLALNGEDVTFDNAVSWTFNGNGRVVLGGPSAQTLTVNNSNTVKRMGVNNENGVTLDVAPNTLVVENLRLTDGQFDVGDPNNLDVSPGAARIVVVEGGLQGGEFQPNQEPSTLTYQPSGDLTTGIEFSGDLTDVSIEPTSSGATVTAGSAATVSGSLLLKNGTFATADNLTILDGATVTRTGGALSGSPTFPDVPGGDNGITLRYVGSSDVTTGSELPSSYSIDELVVDNSDLTVTADTSSSVTTLTLSSGTLDLNEDSLSVFGNASVNGSLQASQDGGVILGGGSSSSEIDGTYTSLPTVIASKDKSSNGSFQTATIKRTDGADPASVSINGDLRVTSGNLAIDADNGDNNNADNSEISEVSVAGSFDIQSGARQLDTNPADGDDDDDESDDTVTISVAGDYNADPGSTNDQEGFGDFTPLNFDDKVVLDGDEQQSVFQRGAPSGVSSTKFDFAGFEVDNEAGVTAESSIITSTLALESGTVSMGENLLDVTSGNSGAVSGTGTVNGTLQRTLGQSDPEAGTFEFPLSADGSLQEATIVTDGSTLSNDATVTVTTQGSELAGDQGLPFTTGSGDSEVEVNTKAPVGWTVSFDPDDGTPAAGEAPDFRFRAQGLDGIGDVNQLRVISRAGEGETGNPFSVAGTHEDALFSGGIPLAVSSGVGGFDISNTQQFTFGSDSAVNDFADADQPAGQVAISGSVNYPTVENGELVDGRALEGVEVEATSGDVTETATTDADGNFTIGGLSSGDYEVTANVDRDVSNVSIGDAQRTVSGFAGTEPFAGTFQEEVANVNARSGTNATDALRIAFFDLGSISSFEAGSFLVDTTEVTLGSESESGVSIRVAEFGDADLSGGSSDSGGDASLATTTVSPKSSAQTAAKSATESAGDANRVAAGETFEVPVRVDRGAEVGSYSLSLEYDTEKATFEGISSGRDDIITNGSKEEGTLQVGWFDRSGESTLELTGGSELVTLRFSAAEGVEGAEFAPEITSGEINGPGAKAVAAGVETQAVRIAKPAPDEFALNGSYPNPASQQATVEMDLPVRAQVTVEVYNTLGQRVQTVEQSMSAGAGQTVQLDASQLASGQYFYRVKASLDGNQTRETGRLTIVK